MNSLSSWEPIVLHSHEYKGKSPHCNKKLYLYIPKNILLQCLNGQTGNTAEMRKKSIVCWSVTKYCWSVTKSCLMLWPHELEHTRLPCPSLSPGVFSNSCPLSQWCYLTISPSATLVSFCPLFTRNCLFPFMHCVLPCFPGGSDVKESACDAGDPSLIPGWGRSPGGERAWPPLQYSCLENPMDRETLLAIVPGVTQSQTRPNDCCFLSQRVQAHSGGKPCFCVLSRHSR